MTTDAIESPSSRATKVAVIEPPGRWPSLGLQELWTYRDLLSILVWRDISIRYKQSLIGIGWAIIQPLVVMIVFSVIFGRLAGLPSGDIPYPIFTLGALLPWNYFSRSLTGASDSLLASVNLVTKVYFPRLILPLSKALVGLVDFAIGFVLLLALMIWYRQTPHLGIVLLPLFLLLAFMAAVGVGLWLSALNVKYRDVGLAVPFLTQVWLFASPVAYSSTLIPEQWRWLYGLNPMVGVIEGFRWALLRQSTPDVRMMAVSALVTLAILVGGFFYFKRTERSFADLI